MEYAHLPIILNSDGKKMSNCDKAFSVKWLLEEGFLPSAIANYLILIGNKAPVEIFDMKDAYEWFDIKNISNSPVKFDIDKLRFINQEHLKNLDDKELSRYVGFADDDIGKLAKIYLEEASTLKELRSKISPIFSERLIAKEFKDSYQTLHDVIKNAPFFETYDEFELYTMKESGLKDEKFFKTMRIVLTNAEHGPDLSQVYECIKNYLGEIVK
jgi:glutamyl-tRNA synthetase